MADFDSDTLIEECLVATKETDARRAVREVLLRTLVDPAPVAAALGDAPAGLHVLYNTPELTVLNVIWAPGMELPPHDHRMWANIGIYGGAEDNTLYKRGEERLQRSGARELRERDVLALGADAIHAVRNPERRYTGALHVYGGDFINQPRSQWDPDTMLEEAWDLAHFQQLFRKANEEWRAQAGHDVDETAD